MWEAPQERLNFFLPVGFRLMEDEDFVCLYKGDRQIAVFNSKAVDPQEIEKKAAEYIF